MYRHMFLCIYMAVLFSTLWGTTTLLSTVAVPLAFIEFHLHSPTVKENSFFSTSSPTLRVSCVLFSAILTGVRWYLFAAWILLFLMMTDVEHLFVCVGYQDVFFREMSYKCPFLIRLFVFWVLYTSLYILDANPVLDMSLQVSSPIH